MDVGESKVTLNGFPLEHDSLGGPGGGEKEDSVSDSSRRKKVTAQLTLNRYPVANPEDE